VSPQRRAEGLRGGAGRRRARPPPAAAAAASRRGGRRGGSDAGRGRSRQTGLGAGALQGRGERLLRPWSHFRLPASGAQRLWPPRGAWETSARPRRQACSRSCRAPGGSSAAPTRAGSSAASRPPPPGAPPPASAPCPAPPAHFPCAPSPDPRQPRVPGCSCPPPPLLQLQLRRARAAALRPPRRARRGGRPRAGCRATLSPWARARSRRRAGRPVEELKACGFVAAGAEVAPCMPKRQRRRAVHLARPQPRHHHRRSRARALLASQPRGPRALPPH